MYDINKVSIISAYCYWCKGSTVGYARATRNLIRFALHNFPQASEVKDMLGAAAQAVAWFHGTSAEAIKKINIDKVKAAEEKIALLEKELEKIKSEKYKWHPEEYDVILEKRQAYVKADIDSLKAEIKEITK